MPVRSIICALVFLALCAGARAEEFDLARYQTVAVEPVKTSIYVGNVTLTMPTFTREGGTYATTYAAKVFPYFFYNEKGKLWIDFSDDELRRLERKEVVNFTGHATSDDGEPRRIEGRAAPDDAATGRIKVRVFVSKKIELIFNTTYRFAPRSEASAGAREQR
jgi:hypothetical protein